MPCRECGESAKEKHDGACVGLVREEDGTARYICLDCVIEKLESQLDDDDG
jgi:hypothetical protein